MTPLQPIVSVEEAVVNALREDILRLRLEPGARLRMADVAERAGVSLTPARQALRRLEAEGLVVSSARLGSRVAPLTWADAEVVLAVCWALERRLIAAGVPRLQDGDLKQIKSLLKERDSAAKAHDVDHLVAAALRIREIVYARANRPYLAEQAVTWRRRQQRYIQHARATVPDSNAFLGSEFTAYVRACLRRDADAAEQAMGHIEDKLSEWLLKTLPAD